MLQGYVDKKDFVKINRTVCDKEENLSGCIIGMSKHFLFLQLDYDFMLDGYAIIRWTTSTALGIQVMRGHKEKSFKPKDF